jgi:hypothetical protein
MLPNVWRLFEDHVFPAPTTDEAFNPYRTRHPNLDAANAPALRRSNLRAYLEAYEESPPLFLLLEAPGPWGCRFSGVPITSEAHLVDPDFPISGRPTSTKAEPHTEYSASIFWRVLQPHFPHFFVWNSLPLHPHDPDDPLTIRTPRRTEVREWQDLLIGLLDTLQPTRIVGVGRKAERALDEAGADPTYVRHPSQGGAKKFEAGINAIVDDLGL